MVKAQRELSIEYPGQKIPMPLVFEVTGEDIWGMSTKFKDRYVICISQATRRIMKDYFSAMISPETPKEIAEKMENDMAENCMRFVLYHEYSHIYLGHIEYGTESPDLRKGKEIEADMVAMDALVKRTAYRSGQCNKEILLAHLFFVIVFLILEYPIRHLEDFPNDPLNYYDPERKGARTHPLSTERIGCIYKQFTESILSLTNIDIKMEEIENVLCDMLEPSKSSDGINIALIMPILDSNIEEYMGLIQVLREEIPRLGDM